MPREITTLITRDVPILQRDEPVLDAVAEVLRSGLPALPVADRPGAKTGPCAGVFGEREFMQALFPGYVNTLSSAGFVRRSIEEVLEKRGSCAAEPVEAYMTAEHVEVGEDFSDVQIAETFLHHRVLIVPVVNPQRIVGVVTRSDFFKALAERFLAGRS